MEGKCLEGQHGGSFSEGATLTVREMRADTALHCTALHRHLTEKTVRFSAGVLAQCSFNWAHRNYSIA